jgi:type I restriction enzyme, S subunit
MKFPLTPLSEIARPVVRPIPVVPGTSYRTIGVKWWEEGAYERETIDGSQTAAKTLSIVHEDDLIINKIWVRHGSTAIVSQAVDGCAASGEFPTFELDQTQVIPRWIYWLTKTRGFWSKCDSLSHGTSGKNRIKPELFLTIQIPLPSLNEQRRIMARIEELVARIEQVKKLQQEVAAYGYRILLSLYAKLTQGTKSLPMRDVAPLERRLVQIDIAKDYPELGIRSFGKGTFHHILHNNSRFARI